ARCRGERSRNPLPLGRGGCQEKTRFASSSDAGEFEVEQFYVDHMFTDKAGMTAGVFLMPVGLLNEHHEPTAYYGVYRNFIETLIIPTTWTMSGSTTSTAPRHSCAMSATTWGPGTKALPRASRQRPVDRSPPMVQRSPGP